MSHIVGKPTMWFPNRSDSNRPVQLQKQARSLKFWSCVEEELYYLSSENKGADQPQSYCEAYLRLCFRIDRLLVVPCGGSNVCLTTRFNASFWWYFSPARAVCVRACGLVLFSRFVTHHPAFVGTPHTGLVGTDTINTIKYLPVGTLWLYWIYAYIKKSSRCSRELKFLDKLMYS